MAEVPARSTEQKDSASIVNVFNQLSVARPGGWTDAIRHSLEGYASVELIERVATVPPGTRVWHYTTADGLLGILSKNCLWATGIDQMNDPLEGIYGFELLRDRWLELRGVDGAGLSDEIAVGFLDLMIESHQPQNARESLHIFSASLDEDSLAMWRFYGDDDGYAVCFEVDDLSSLIIVDDDLSPLEVDKAQANGLVQVYARVEWAPVLYDKESQDVLAHAVLLRLAHSARETRLEFLKIAGGEAAWGAASAQVLVPLMSHYVNLFAATVKPAAFAHEREARLIITNCGPQERRYRSSGGRLVPYVQLALPAGTEGRHASPLIPVAVRCSPLIPENAMLVVQSMLTTLGHHDTPVTQSGIQYRR